MICKNICFGNNSLFWHCEDYSAAPVSDYINNPIFQELAKKIVLAMSLTKEFTLTYEIA